MYKIPMHEVGEEFTRCWRAARRHLESQTHDGPLSWLKPDLAPPYLEHLSFRMGNQLFFIRIEDVDGNVCGPGILDGLRRIAKGCNGIPCRMPMRRTGAKWNPELPGWSLLHADTGQPLNPITLISDEKIEMTDWEVHDFAVQVVRDYSIGDKFGRKLIASQGDPEVNPSIWFVGEDGPEWVVVRAVRYPENEAALPENIADIAAYCARESNIGHFASVSFANSEDPFDSSKAPPLPLWRGYAVYASFQGLVPVKV